jgi:hypothetical protein
MALTELLSTLSIGTYEQEFPAAFIRPTGPGSTNGDPQDGSLFKDSNGNGIPDRTISGYTSNGQFTTFATKEASYNKFNLRTDSHNKNSFGNVTDQPFILRGLQRPNSAQPQFWGGFADTLTDIPRGGITTAVEREAVDKARIGKFMISPKGLIFQAKQFGLQLMNPNVEGEFGIWSGVTPRSNKIYNPLSVFSMNSPVPMHVRRDSFDPSGLTSYSYESVINTRNVAQNAIISNRLNLLRFEAFFTNRPVGLPYLTISNFTGPKSVLGVGVTTNNRYTNTSLRQSSLLLGAPGLEFITSPLGIATGAGINTGATYDINRYKNSNILADLRTYLQPTPLSPKYTPGQDDTQWSKNGRTKIRAIIDNPISFPQDSKVLGKNDGTTNDLGKKYATVAYGNLNNARLINVPILGPLAVPDSYNDFRDDISEDAKNFSIGPGNTGVGKNAKDKEYKDSNLVKRIGIGDYGAITLDRSDPRYVIDNNATVIRAHKDKADQLVLGNSTKDLVQFSMTTSDGAGNPDKVIRFRSYINSISNGWSVEEVDGIISDYTQVLKSPIYTGVSHQLTIDFSIPILSAVERTTIMNKLNTLAKLFYGNEVKNDQQIVDADGNVTTTFDVTRDYVKLLPLRIGNFIKMPCVMTSLSYDIDNETPWDIDNETPMVIQCSIGVNEISYKGNPSATNNIGIIGF